MSTEIQEKENVQTETKPKKRRGTWLLILLLIVVILFLLSTILLGSKLYELTSQDQYTVDLGLGADGEIELFRIEYANESGEITVQGANGENVVAPGTTVNYHIRLRNKDDVAVEFIMEPTVDFLTKDIVPIQFKVMDTYGNYLLGDEETWVGYEDLNALAHKGVVQPGEVFTYYVSWQWLFEVDQEQDAYDTYLGSQDGSTLPGVRVGVQTHASAQPAVQKTPSHMAHLLGEGFGCCWCCYLVWILLLVCLLMLIWVWRLRRKLSKREETMEDYEEVLTAHGLLVDGKLVERAYEIQ